MKNFTSLILSALFFVFISLKSYSQSTATYDITFQSSWNATEHSSTPSNAHWSDLVGATHKNENEFLQIGQNATTGIKNVAEFGSNGVFMSEVQNSSNTKEWLSASFNPFAAISSATLTDVEFTEEHHLLTLVSMVAPSPDWFIAINSLNLRNATNTDWKDTFTIDVFVYDSGTDSGTNYTSGNAATNPVQPITMLNGFPVNGNKIGTLTVTQKSVTLSVDDFSVSNTISIYPNPSKGAVTITNAADVKTLVIYSVLGQQVKQIDNTNNNTFQLELDNVNKGIYLLKFIDASGSSSVKKLILE